MTASDATDGTKTANTSPSMTVNARRAFVKLQTILPVKPRRWHRHRRTGGPTAETANTSFNMTVNAVDGNWNVVTTVTDGRHHLVGRERDTAGQFGARRRHEELQRRFVTGSPTLRRPISPTGRRPEYERLGCGACRNFAKLQLLLPGETAAPGTASGKTGADGADGRVRFQRHRQRGGRELERRVLDRPGGDHVERRERDAPGEY